MCLGHLPESSLESTVKRVNVSSWCSECETARKRLRDRERKRKVPTKSKTIAALKISRRKNKRLVMQVLVSFINKFVV